MSPLLEHELLQHYRRGANKKTAARAAVSPKIQPDGLIRRLQ